MSWVCEAPQVGKELAPVRRAGSNAPEPVRSLRDWLDAYRYFDLPVFVEDPAAFQFVRAAATTNSAGIA